MDIPIEWLHQIPQLTQLEPLGRGGQKTVFKATHPVDGDVVLKVFHPQQDAAQMDREILAASAINSVRVPRIRERGVINTPIGLCNWLREELVTGLPLRAVLNKTSLDLATTIRLARHILEALSDAENASIVHRDVKPDNIIWDTLGDFWLIDFGIARHLTLESLTPTSDIFGKLTLGYAPPEQMRNRKIEIDTRSDLFALGVTLVEAFAGSHPFRHPVPPNQFDVIRRVEALEVKVTFGSTPQGLALAELVETMLQKRRTLRPRSAAEALAWMHEIEN